MSTFCGSRHRKAGFADGHSTAVARLNGPAGLAVDKDGSLLIADYGNGTTHTHKHTQTTERERERHTHNTKHTLNKQRERERERERERGERDREREHETPLSLSAYAWPLIRLFTAVLAFPERESVCCLLVLNLSISPSATLCSCDFFHASLLRLF